MRNKPEDGKIRRWEDKKIGILNFSTSQLLSFSLLLLTAYCLLSLAGCSKKDKVFRESRIVMDTICTITVVSNSEKEAKEAIETGFTEIKRLEGLLNYFSPKSEITAINKAAGSNRVKVSAETLELLKRALDIAEATQGAFDPTIGPLTRLWGFHDMSQITPDVPQDDKIKYLLPLIDYKKIKIKTSASEVFLEKEGMEIDLGGIAKGYTADKAIEVIKARGMNSALVAIGGDIKGNGLKPDMKPWKVGIQNPRPKTGVRGQGSGVKDEENIFASLYLENKAISTSGDYQRFFLKNDKRYHHIINPKTGYPAGGIISVSVIASDGYVADGLSTGVFVIGAEGGIKLLESLNLSGIIVDSNKKIFLTNDLKGKINIEKNP